MSSCAGHGIFAIAEGLTRDGIPSPSAHDPARNPHRDTRTWAKTAMCAILDNPRYAGRRVWNRQKKHEALHDIADVSLGYTTKMHWSTQDKWIICKEVVHTSSSMTRPLPTFRTHCTSGQPPAPSTRSTAPGIPTSTGGASPAESVTGVCRGSGRTATRTTGAASPRNTGSPTASSPPAMCSCASPGWSGRSMSGSRRSPRRTASTTHRADDRRGSCHRSRCRNHLHGPGRYHRL